MSDMTFPLTIVIVSIVFVLLTYVHRVGHRGKDYDKFFYELSTKLVGHHMGWLFLDKSAVNNLVEYEARLNHVLSKYNDPLICNSNASPFIPLAA